MPTGRTGTGAVADSLPTVIMAARQVSEYEGVMSQLVDRVTLGQGVGLTWNEISMARMTSQVVTEDTVLDNPQQASDTLFSLTPTLRGIHTFFTDRVALRIDRKAFAQTGTLAQHAIVRGKDIDGITVLDGATTSLSGAGTTLVSGVIAAAAVRITSNATEPGPLPIRCVLHGFQIKDIWDEIVAGVGTYPVGEGLTARVYKEGFKGMISNAQIYEDGNMVIDGSDDTKGGVFSQKGIVMVQGRTPYTKTRDEPHIGGGGTSMFLYDEYVFGERSAGNWLYEIYSDALSPTT